MDNTDTDDTDDYRWEWLQVVLVISGFCALVAALGV